jgi:exodeoxyribonuclease-3
MLPFVLLATWNVNSIKARLERLSRWLETRQPDVVCLQELKVADAAFPLVDIEALGYHTVFQGQKTYNGVAILAKDKPTDVARGLDDGVDDPQARLIAATVGGIRVVCVYVPNGKEVGSDKYEYKLAWLKRLRAWLDRHASPSDPLLLCGDFNVAPEARDVHDPKAWEASVLYHPSMRAALKEVTDFGLHDGLRLVTQDEGIYSWWDYRMLAFPKGRGVRIDHLLVTEPLVARVKDAYVDREERKGKQPSDHAPALLELR